MRSSIIRPRAREASAICLMAAILFAGCSQSNPSSPVSGRPTPQQPPNKSSSNPVPSGDSQPEQAEKVELQVVDFPGYEATIARNKGKVVLADFWATWCGPCRKQFQHTIELQKKYKDKGLVVITVSIDQMDEGEKLDDLKAKVLDFLKGQHATLTNLLVPATELAVGDAGATDLIAERFDLDGSAVPHYKLYDRQGNLNRKFVINLETGEVFQSKEVEVAIEKLF